MRELRLLWGKPETGCSLSIICCQWRERANRTVKITLKYCGLYARLQRWIIWRAFQLMHPRLLEAAETKVRPKMAGVKWNNSRTKSEEEGMKSKCGSSYNKKKKGLQDRPRSVPLCMLIRTAAKQNPGQHGAHSAPHHQEPTWRAKHRDTPHGGAAAAFRDPSSNSSDMFWYLCDVLYLAGWFVQRQTFLSRSTEIRAYLSS